MRWFRNIEREDDLWLLSSEIEELDDDEISLREAAFMEGYEQAEAIDFINPDILEDWDYWD